MNNPYSAPTAEFSSLQETGSDTYEPRFFSLSGRIGRLRYLAYSWGAYILVSIVVGVLYAVLGARTSSSSGTTTASILIYFPMIATALVMAKRRLHDLDKKGWIAILMLVPILNVVVGLYLIFAAGNEGANQYGPPPAKNSGLFIIAACILPLIIIGMMAAVAIPAYHTYVQKAKQSQIGNSQ